KQLLRSPAARPGARSQECFSEDLLLRAAAKQLDRPEREQVASHLAVCSDCVRDYRIAHSVRNWAEQAVITNGLQAPQTIPRQDRTGIRIFAQARARDWSGRAVYRRAFPYAVAASLITVAVLGAWLISIHRSDVRNLERLNAQLADRDRAVHELQQSVDEA